MAEEYLTLAQAAEFVSVSRATLWRRLREEGIQTYQSQQDRRVRLVKRTDLEGMLQPRPIVHTPVIEGKAKPAHNLAA